MSNPLVSVVLTNYNGERFVRQAVDSVLAQTYDNWELIIVDDASTDQSLHILKEYRDPRIRLKVNERNGQVSFSHNVGNAMCRGQYIAALDYDDIWKPEKLEKQVAWMEAHPEVGVCFTWLDIIDESSHIIDDTQTISMFRMENRDRVAWLRELLTTGNHFANDSSLIRTSVMKEIGENDLSLIQLHDYDMWVKIALKHDLYVMPEVLMSYRRLTDGSSITSAGEFNTRQAYFEYSWIIGRTIRNMEDTLFRQVFQKDLIRPDLETPEATLCEKALYLRRDHDLINTKALAFEMLTDLLREKSTRNLLWEEFRVTQHEIYTMTREPIQVDPDMQEKIWGFEVLQLNDLSNKLQLMENSFSWRITRPIRSLKLYAGRFHAKHPRPANCVKTALALVKKGPEAARDVWKNCPVPPSKILGLGAEISADQAEKEKRTVFTKEIRFSILVPLYNTPRTFLTEMIRSVQNQTYAGWELCLADGSDADHSWVGEICRKQAKKDSRIRYTHLEENGGISENTNACLNLATGSWIGLLDHDDLLHPSALYEVMKAICDRNADFVYTDENTFIKKPSDAYDPHFKPDFSPDTLRAVNYICHFTAFDRSLLEKAGGPFRSEFDGSQDYDLVLRLTEQAKHIVHIPRVLYFWRAHQASTAQSIGAKPYVIDAAKKAIGEQLDRLGLKGQAEDSKVPSMYRMRYEIEGNPLISIIIPSWEHKEDLSRCLDSIYRLSTYKNFEIIIVENNSQSREIFDYYEEVKKKYGVQVVVWNQGFNFSAICNFGFSAAGGDYVLLLNNDTEVITPDWLQEMLMYAQRKDVGAVGAMLYYPNDTIQHAGIILGIQGIAGHSHKYMPRGTVGYKGRLCYAQNLSAVTGACMMIPRHVYLQVNGYDKGFRVAFNDVDFCLRVRQAGYLIVFTPFAELYHHESLSRGSDMTPANRQRFISEINRFRNRWGAELEAGDPYYNPNLSLEKEDFSLR